MASLKNEIIWEVDEFPPEPDSQEAGDGLNSVSVPLAQCAVSTSQRPGETVLIPPPHPVVVPELPDLTVSTSAVTPHTQAPSPPSQEHGQPTVRSVPSQIQSAPLQNPVTPVTASVASCADQSTRQLVRGERLELKSLLSGESGITFDLLGPSPEAVKFICLGLDANERLVGPEYCVGPRQPFSPCRGIHHQTTTGGGHSITLYPASLPANLKRLEFSAVAATPGGIVGTAVTGLRIGNSKGTAESTDLSLECASSACVTLVEVYDRQGEWRLRVIGEVVANSVDELLRKHGASRQSSR
jgi:stress response protein SCP2